MTQLYNPPGKRDFWKEASDAKGSSIGLEKGDLLLRGEVCADVTIVKGSQVETILFP